MGAMAALCSVAFAGGNLSVVSNSVEVASSSSGGLFATCPKGSTAVGGGFSLDGNASKETSGYFPSSRRRFAVTGRNNGGGPFELLGFAVCDASGKFERAQKSRVLQDQEIATVRAKCPKGTTVAGGGLRLLDEDFEVYRSAPSGQRRWEVEAGYFADGSQTVIAYAVCNLAGDPYKVRTRSETAPSTRRARGIPAVVTLRPKCNDGREPVAGGFDVEGSGSFNPVRSQPDGARWESKFDTYFGKNLDFTGYVVCGSR